MQRDDKTGNMAYKVNAEYPNWLIQELNTQRANKRFCDVILKCGTREFPAHRNVLSAASPYFNSLLDGGFTENTQQVIDLTKSFPVPDILESVLKYIYTGVVDIDYNNLVDLLQATSFLCLDGAKSLLGEALSDSLDLSNCVDIFTMASKYDVQNIIELSARVIGSRLHDCLYDGEELYELDPDLLLSLVVRWHSGFQYLSDAEALHFMKKYIEKWFSHDTDNDLLVTSVHNLGRLFEIRNDVKTEAFWENILGILSYKNVIEKGRQEMERQFIETIRSVDGVEICDAARFGRISEEQGDILILQTNKTSVDADESNPKVFYAYDTGMARWVKLFESTRTPKRPEYNYEVLGISNDFLIMFDRQKNLYIFAISLSDGDSQMKAFNSPHSCFGPCSRGTFCMSHIFVAENLLFCIDPLRCCDTGHDPITQIRGYCLKKFNWDSPDSEWGMCADIPLCENLDFAPEVLDSFGLHHRELGLLASLNFVTAVKGSELVIFTYKHNRNSSVTHFVTTTLNLDSPNGSYNPKTVSVGELDWGGLPLLLTSVVGDFSLSVSERENHIKVVLLAERYEGGTIAVWTIETKEMSESEISRRPRILIQPVVSNMTKPWQVFNMGLPLTRIEEDEDAEDKFSPYRLSPNTGYVYCIENYGPYVNLMWKCELEKNRDEGAWIEGELPPPPSDEIIEGFELLRTPRNVRQKLLSLPRAKFEDRFADKDEGPYFHTIYKDENAHNHSLEPENEN